MSIVDYRALLQSVRSKATPTRLTVLRILHGSHKPLSVNAIKKSLPSHTSEVTIYRILETLAKGGVVKRVDFEHDHAHYELAALRPHHHHLICKSCGTVEDIEECVAEDFGKAILKQSKKFKTISHHALEFFGLCRVCARRI